MDDDDEAAAGDAAILRAWLRDRARLPEARLDPLLATLRDNEIAVITYPEDGDYASIYDYPLVALFNEARARDTARACARRADAHARARLTCDRAPRSF